MPRVEKAAEAPQKRKYTRRDTRPPAKFAEDYMQEQGPERVIPASGPARVEDHKDRFGPDARKPINKARHEDGKIILVKEVPSREQAEMLAYMEEPIDVIVSDSVNPNDEPIPYAGVNGVRQFFQRGVMQTVKRKFVNALASIQGRYEQRQRFNPETGEREYSGRMVNGMRYPFTVVRDDHPIDPRGRNWLKDLMSGQGGR